MISEGTRQPFSGSRLLAVSVCLPVHFDHAPIYLIFATVSSKIKPRVEPEIHYVNPLGALTYGFLQNILHSANCPESYGTFPDLSPDLATIPQRTCTFYYLSWKL